MYDFTLELLKNRSLSDVTYGRRALSKFGEQGIIDMVGISGYYTMIAMVLNTARTPQGHEHDGHHTFLNLLASVKFR